MKLQLLSDNELFLKNIPWTESPFFDDLLEQTNYSADVKEKIKFFADKGYLIINPEIENFDDLAQDIITSLKEEQHKHGSRVQDAWRYQPNVQLLASHPTIIEWLKILYQRDPIPFQTLNFCKGTEQATHSDLVHFSSVPQRFMAGVWFALEDVDQNNGALHYYPGSHKLPFYDLHDFDMSKSTLNNRDRQYKKYEQFINALLKSNGLKKFVCQSRLKYATALKISCATINSAVKFSLN